MIEKWLSISAISTAGLFALLGIVAVAKSNFATMIAAIVLLSISIMLAVAILIVAALPKSPD